MTNRHTITHHHVIVGVDGSVTSVRALDRAADEAALRATALEIVYAVPDLDEAGPVLASAASRARDRHPGLPVATVPVQGHPAAVLAERGGGAALTVVGCRGLGAFTGTVFGSVSRRLALHTPGPLLVVRGDSPSRPSRDGGFREPSRPYGEVLLVLDDENEADVAGYALREAELRGARLRTFRSPAHRRAASAAVPHGQNNERAAPRLPVNGVPTEPAERQPLVPVEIRDAASASVQPLLEATRTADLAVVARRSGPGRHGPQLGAVARTLLYRAHCPVLIVPVWRETTAPHPS